MSDFAAPSRGLMHGISNEQYHKGAGLSSTGARRILKSPYHYHALTLTSSVPPNEPTAAMMNGTLVHCAVLEPDEWERRYVVAPEAASDRRTKAFREFSVEASSRGLEVITQQQADRARAQAAALRALPDVAKLLQHGHAESSAYWCDRRTGVHCKCRPDFAGHDLGLTGSAVILLDVKTTSDASPEGFAKSVWNFGYHMQADWYCEGYSAATGHEVLGMLFAAVESEYPHAAALYSLDLQAMELGRAMNKRARETYAYCSEHNEWPSYTSGVVEICLPSWARKVVNEYY